MIGDCISNLSYFRMSLFDSSSSEAELSKLHAADHNMNSSAGTEGKHAAFPFPAFPQFPFLPIPGLSQQSLPTVPLSLNLTGQLEEASPKSAESESPKSSPTGKIEIHNINLKVENPGRGLNSGQVRMLGIRPRQFLSLIH